MSDAIERETERHYSGEDYELLAAAFLNGEVTVEQMTQVEEHVLDCPVCRKMWAAEDALQRVGAGVIATHFETAHAKALKRARVRVKQGAPAGADD